VSVEASLDTARLARTLTLIVFVTAVFLFLLAQRLSGELLQVGIVATGSIAVITAVLGFLIAAAAGYD
jgi:hypothetical protein